MVETTEGRSIIPVARSFSKMIWFPCTKEFILEWITSLYTSSRTLFVCVSVGMSTSCRTSSYISRQIVIERRVT